MDVQKTQNSQVPQQTLPPAPVVKRGTSLVQVIIISMIIGALSGGAVAGGIYYLAVKDPAIAKQLKPISDFLAQVQMKAGDKDVVQVTVEENSAVTAAVEKAQPAVVSIIGTVQVQDFFFNRIYEDDFAGTGFVIDREQGLILTNRHVVEEVAEYKILTASGEEIPFTQDNVSLDPANDLAIIQVDIPADMEIGEVELGDSSQLVPGQLAIAIGNALGTFDNTVTVGVISALGRQISASSGTSGQELLLNVIQTDAAINQGNSGGPLLNAEGQVIGINSAIASGSAENIGFAIPVDDAKVAIESYLVHGSIVRPWLGVEYVQLTKDISLANDLPTEEGAYINNVVYDGPAEKAGILAGDIILALDDELLTADNSLVEVMQQFQIDDVIEVRLLRPDNPQADSPVYEEELINVSLEERPVLRVRR
ncbi:MAG TPA: trypsin-like peptidase domain-containing protein [bacterium]|nr:trypsin-like peptidase domain-containing protein [bacterium]